MNSLLVSLLIFCLIAGLIYWVIGLLPLPPVVRQIALVVFALFALIWLLESLPLGAGFGFHRLG